MQAEVVETIGGVNLGGGGRGTVGLGVAVGGTIDQSGGTVGELSSLVHDSAGNGSSRKLGSTGTRASGLVNVGVVRLIKGTEVRGDGEGTVNGGVLAERSDSI